MKSESTGSLPESVANEVVQDPKHHIEPFIGEDSPFKLTPTIDIGAWDERGIANIPAIVEMSGHRYDSRITLTKPGRVARLLSWIRAVEPKVHYTRITSEKPLD